MGTKTAATAVLTVGGRCVRAVRSLSPVAVIATTLVVVLGGVGIADAATGGALILGKSNFENSKASLSSSHGTPLSLSAPENTAPLAVNRRTMVKNLNAQFVGGLSASALKPTGGDDFSAPGKDIPILPLAATRVAKTGPLPAGIYYVTATAEVDLGSGVPGAMCFITLNGDVSHPLQEGGENGGPHIQTAETVAVSVHNKNTLQEWCEIQGGNGGTEALDAAITAIRVLSSSGTKPASASSAAHSATRSR